jgi:hypothetical protein
MSNPKKVAKKRNQPLDTFPAKPGRGRRARIRSTEVAGRAANFRWIFEQVWDRLWPLLDNATGEEDVVRAFQEGASPFQRGQFVPLAALAFQVLHERKFPKRRQARINFLADSLAGVGVVTPRRSRDICAQERAKEKRAKSAHHIIRYEFYVECSCGYRGRSQDHLCAKCGAAINFGSISTLSPFLSGIDAGGYMPNFEFNFGEMK